MCVCVTCSRPLCLFICMLCSFLSCCHFMSYCQSPYQDSGLQRVPLRQNLNLRGWNSRDHMGFPRNCEPTSPSRDNLSREIGRKLPLALSFSPASLLSLSFGDFSSCLCVVLLVVNMSFVVFVLLSLLLSSL